MAGYLAKAGNDVSVYNRTTAKAEKWVAEYGGIACDTPKAAADGAEFVMACVGNDDDLRSVILGDTGALAGMANGSVLVDHTTASANVAREVAQLATDAGCGFIDAPVSGGQAGAENGALTVMCGGDASTFDSAKPQIDHYAKSVKLMGDVGAGQLTKMVNQICIAGLVQGLSEGLHFAEQAGLDARAVIEAISKGAAQSWQMENRFDTMLDREFNHGFAVDWMRKDLGIALDEAKRNKSNLPVTEIVDQYYSEVQDMGGARWDTSSLIARLASKPPSKA